MNSFNYDICIIGGGPAGSTAGCFLSEKGFNVCLVEREIFPREKLCGEFLSHEVTVVLKSLKLYDEFLSLEPNKIKTFRLMHDQNIDLAASLNFDAYGLRRSTFDSFLLNSAQKRGVHIFQPFAVKNIVRSNNHYEIILKNRNNNTAKITASSVIGAYGKHSIIDKMLERNFVDAKSNLAGIKFHTNYNTMKNLPKDEIQIYTGKGIYCGVNSVDNEKVTICFLVDRKLLNDSPIKNLSELINKIQIFKNIFTTSFESLANTASFYGAGNIYFGKKDLMHEGVFMIGDAARMIAPLTGDGIGMAMESAKLVSEVLTQEKKLNRDRKLTEHIYRKKWEELFNNRVKTARFIQAIMLSNLFGNSGYRVLKLYPGLLSGLINLTRG